jgi:hypothetical protein
MTPFTTAQRDAARSLAISYHAYHEACSSGDLAGKIQWGTRFLVVQKCIGLEIHDPNNMQAIIDFAGETLARVSA